jgi:Uma2 family endonuclease
MPPADIAGPPQGAWTYEDYCALPDDGRRYEILAGVLYVAPSPNADHQTALIEMTTALNLFLRATRLGKLMVVPFDVRLQIGTVVQPDLLVVLAGNLERFARSGINGAPDLVIEIASPGTATYDRHAKLKAYERAAVPEYRIVDPGSRTVELFVLEGGVYRQVGAYQEDSTVPSTILAGLDVPVRSFFG